MTDRSELLADVSASLGALSAAEREQALKMLADGCSVQSVIAAIKRGRDSLGLEESDASNTDTPERPRG